MSKPKQLSFILVFTLLLSFVPLHVSAYPDDGRYISMNSTNFGEKTKFYRDALEKQLGTYYLDSYTQYGGGVDGTTRVTNMHELWHDLALTLFANSADYNTSWHKSLLTQANGFDNARTLSIAEIAKSTTINSTHKNALKVAAEKYPFFTEDQKTEQNKSADQTVFFKQRSSSVTVI